MKINVWGKKRTLISFVDLKDGFIKHYADNNKKIQIFILTAAPERTERRSGLEGSAREAPMSRSMKLRPSKISSHKPSGSFLPATWYC